MIVFQQLPVEMGVEGMTHNGKRDTEEKCTLTPSPSGIKVQAQWNRIKQEWMQDRSDP